MVTHCERNELLKTRPRGCSCDADGGRVPRQRLGCLVWPRRGRRHMTREGRDLGSPVDLDRDCSPCSWGGWTCQAMAELWVLAVGSAKRMLTDHCQEARMPRPTSATLKVLTTLMAHETWAEVVVAFLSVSEGFFDD